MSESTNDGAGRPRALPADASEIERLLLGPAPERNRRPHHVAILGLFAVGALLATFLIPRATRPEATVTFGEPISHDRAMLVRVVLPAMDVGRPTELEAELLFRYAAANDEFEAARSAIGDNWDYASDHVATVLSGYTRDDVVTRLGAIEQHLPAELSASLFPGERGRVTGVGWRFITLR